MHSSPSFWFGSPKGELSAAERARQSVKRESRLEQHMLQSQFEPAGVIRPGSGTTRPPARSEQRDPLELQRGVDVQVLSDSAYDKLFPPDSRVKPQRFKKPAELPTTLTRRESSSTSECR